jgi:hypothetical protein
MAMQQDPVTGEWFDDGLPDIYNPPQSTSGGGEVFGYSQGGPGTDPGYGSGINMPDTGAASGDDAARRDMLRGNFQGSLGREPTDAELDEALRHYYASGGDAARGHIESLGWGDDEGGGGVWDGMRRRPNYTALRPFQFKRPTMEDLYADPSYATRRDEGRQALEQSASGKGILRTGGTLKDIVHYGQNFASREYGNVYDRRFKEAQAEYEPVVREWEMENRFNELEFNREFDMAMAELDDDYRYVALGASL